MARRPFESSKNGLPPDDIGFTSYDSGGVAAREVTSDQGSQIDGGEDSSPSVEGGVCLTPVADLRPKRKIDLSRAALPDLGSLKTVDSLCVRELKGVGATFTPSLALAMTFMALAYKPQDEYETIYQIVAGQLLSGPRVMRRARRITFVHVFSWATFETVLMPVKEATYGRRVLEDLRKLQSRFPNYKAFVEWDASRRRHVVHYEELEAQERGAIAGIKWPAQKNILDALQGTAYDDLDDLSKANEDISMVLRSREVD